MVPIIFFVLLFYSLFCLGYGIYIFLKNTQSMLNRMFFSLCTNLSVWSFGYAFMAIASTQEKANFWRIVSAVGWCLIYSVWLDFAMLLIKENKKWMVSIKRLFLYIPSIIIFIGTLQYEPNEVIYQMAMVWRDVYPMDLLEMFYIIYYLTYGLSGILIISYWGMKSQFRREKIQSRIIVVTALISVVLGSFTDVILPEIFGYEIFPVGVIMLSIPLFGLRYVITKYKFMSPTLKDSNDYILNNMNDPVMLLGRDMCIQDINTAALCMTGYRYDEMKGRSISHFIVDSDSESNELKPLILAGTVKNTEVRLCTKNGNEIPCLLSASYNYDQFQDFLGITCIFHDITDRRRAEDILIKAHQELEDKVKERTKALEVSVEKFQALIKQSSDGIIVIDQLTRRVEECNQKAFEILDVYELEKLGSLFNRLSSSTQDEIRSYLDKNRDEKTLLFKQTKKIELLNGQQKDIELSISPVGYNNKDLVMLTLSDVTEKISMEERKQQIAKMESIGTLAGGIAHDFNNILAGIIGYTQLVLEDAELDVTNIDNLQEVLNLGDRAKNLISQILSFSRKSNLTSEIVDLKAIVDDVIKMLRTTITGNIIIQKELLTESAYVNAKPAEMHQLVLNLCVNAELAMRKTSGTLKIILTDVSIEEEREAKVHGLKAGKYIKLEVIDNGCGMDDATVKRIFEPFFTTRGVHEGTGLGLSVVHGIVCRCEGEIMVDSTPGVGSTFTVFLPSVSMSSESIYYQEEVIHRGSERILFIDDEEAIVNTVQKLLVREGYHVTGLTDAIEALNVFRNNPLAYDIIFTDQSMPNLSGDMLIQEIRSMRTDIPIVLCSGYSHDEMDGVDQEITEFLIKPVSKVEYLRVIDKLINRREA